MKDPAISTISVQGNSLVRSRPTSLILLGRIHESAPTLELALQNLKRKRESVSSWLNELKVEVLDFGVPRFPEQVEPDSTRWVRKRLTQRMVKGGLNLSKPGENVNRSVLVSYAAEWPIADKSAEEMLLLVDRIQFEAADFQEYEGDERKIVRRSDRPSWDPNPNEEVQSILSGFEAPPDGEEIYFLFRSTLSPAQSEEALREAFQDGRAKGAITARAAGMELDQLQSAHWVKFETSNTVHDFQRGLCLPLLNETPLRIGPYQAIHESPRAIEFNISVHMTFTLKS